MFQLALSMRKRQVQIATNNAQCIIFYTKEIPQMDVLFVTKILQSHLCLMFPKKLHDYKDKVTKWCTIIHTMNAFTEVLVDPGKE